MQTKIKTRSPWLRFITIAICVFMIGPMFLSAYAGLINNYSVGLKSGFTLRWLIEVWEVYGSTVGWSITLALLCVLCTLLLGVPCAYALARSQSKWANAFEELLTLPVAIPGLASALALILAYGQISAFRQSFGFILVGHVIFTLPFMVRTVSSALQKHELYAIEEAARTLGASFLRRFIGVIIPAVFPAIVAGSMMVFTLSIGEFNLTWMLHTPLTRTLPVGLADSYASMRVEIGSAYTLVFFMVILPVLLIMQGVANYVQKKYGN
ncbi:MAG TPA: ABC transporter permease subunit [Alcaligenaceae bacterium]|uniref:ABC transporter permease n=1 Tax=uncultured Paenalcaligenes sp. TaxID=1588925 RepID=UPI001775CAF9|nr:ABC transporter permease subunit [uncultured Paenalcaligenes sp.]HHU93514.1 ABC transporter permease subunit [Alcaligenaceae bacterium]